MAQNEMVERLARHLAEGADVEGELALLYRQSLDKQGIVAKRLKVLDRYLSDSSQSVPDAEAAADEIGVSRRQLYRLIAKMRELGPVRALTPGFRNVERSAPTKTGLEPPVEASIRHWLSHVPEGKISKVQAFVRAECERLRVEYPGDSAVKRRVHNLRRQALLSQTSGKVGDRIAVDQVALDLSVRWVNGNTLSVMTLIWDRGTQLILGMGLTVGDGMGMGLEQALFDFRTRRASELERVVHAAPHIGELTWVVPAGLEYTADVMGQPGSNDDRRPKITVIATGPRRHGDAILRSLGDRIEPYHIRKLTDLREDPPASDDFGMELTEAWRAVSRAVDNRNSMVLAKLRASAPPLFIPVEGQMARIADELTTLFAPVLGAVEARQKEAHLKEHGWTY